MALKPHAARWTPEESGDAVALPKRDAPASAEFRFVFLPERWNWIEDTGEWLPALAEMTYTPGVNGISAKKGPQASAPAKAMINGKGGTVIEPNERGLGRFAPYLHKFKNESGHDVWRSIFESVEVVGKRALWDRDEEEYREFCRTLLTQQIVPKIHPHIAAEKIAVVQERVKRMVARVGGNPTHEGLRAELERLQATVYGMEHNVPLADAIAALRGEQRPSVDVDATGEPKTEPKPTTNTKQGGKGRRKFPA